MENTLENKAKFFAQYWNQDCFFCGRPEQKEPYKVYHYQGILEKYPDISYLHLKPLSSITDEDANAITIYGLYSKGRFNEVGYDTPSGFQRYSSDSIDFIRSRGYAIRYLGLSVEKMIEYGWIKLQEV